MQLRKTNVVTLTVAGVLATAGLGWAAIPSSDGVIRSCYNASSNPSGGLRVIDAEAGAKCAKNEKPLNFNQQGPKGETGPQGLPGKDGVDGTNGVNGADGRDGIDGTNGTDGAPGPPGLAGPSDAYIGRCDGCQIISNPGATLVSLGLPTGVYAVYAQADIQNTDNDSQEAQCRLSTGARGIIRIGSHDDFGGTAEVVDRSEIFVQDLLTMSAPGAVTLFCSTYSGFATDAKLTAIKVGAIHG